jgi:predicted nuclease with TOPRIM domain
MDITHYMFAGVTLALSVLGFFLKKVKIEVDGYKDRLRDLELSNARMNEQLKLMNKILEDRRKDVQRLYEKTQSK